MIDTFNKTNLQLIREQIKKFFEENDLAEQLEVSSVELGRCSYQDGEATFKLVIKSGGAEQFLEDQVNAYARMMELPTPFYGREFTSNGDRFRITDLKPNRPKYPVIAENLNRGGSYKFQKDAVSRLLKQEV